VDSLRWRRGNCCWKPRICPPCLRNLHTPTLDTGVRCLKGGVNADPSWTCRLGDLRTVSDTRVVATRTLRLCPHSTSRSIQRSPGHWARILLWRVREVCEVAFRPNEKNAFLTWCRENCGQVLYLWKLAFQTVIISVPGSYPFADWSERCQIEPVLEKGGRFHFVEFDRRPTSVYWAS
jgi:hypothetical protein